MKKIILIFLLLLIIGCKDQKKEKRQAMDKAQKDSLGRPDGQWGVNREYDEQGNLTEYDSIYLYSYADQKGDSVQVNLDSIMDSFRGYLKKHKKWNDEFFFFPKKDSMFMKDFFKEDYFLHCWEKEPMHMGRMVKQMDSIRNAFMRKHHPGLIESKKKN
ncbi:MAG TPA: hypothetical protein VLZ54_07035 [Arenibacter sp.]|nr:hypothetical protein [Arenibacter sp.]